MVKKKTKAIVGIWFFQMVCHLGATGMAYLIAAHPTKAMEGDKALDVWAEWIKTFLPPSHSLKPNSLAKDLNVADSLYGGKKQEQNQIRKG